MPYINKEMQQRKGGWTTSLKNKVDALALHLAQEFEEDEVEGALNYTISRIIAGTLGHRGWIDALGHRGWRYKFLNRAIGVLECAKLEFYRRLAAPYEDKAIEKNGDIPEYTE